jgi:electron transport complex protein RnfD
MSDQGPKVLLRTSPHLRVGPPVDVIMRNVVYALLPVCAFAIYQFGISVLALIIVCTASCILTEHLVCRLSGKATTVGDWSAVITGILLALCLPPGFPLWMGAVAAFAGVGLGKMFFGGLGFNVMNPALIGRAFAQASFTVPITTWSPMAAEGRFSQFIPSSLTLPFLKPEPIKEWIAQVAPDGFSGATPLAQMKFEHFTTCSPMELLLGSSAGSAGETSALLILLCGAYLVFRRMMDWRITASILITAGGVSGIFYMMNPALYPDPVFTLCTGGLMLGAVFMATDMVASPVTPAGVWIYGALIGVVTVIIRLFGGLNEGVMYAILLGNACSPLISMVTQPRIYGAKKPKGAA